MSGNQARLRAILMLGLVVISAISRAATPAQTRDAIEKAKTNLYNLQLKDHTWEFDHASHGDQKTGQTALAVYALLSAGESRQDPRLIPTIEYLKKTETTGVYALGMRCQVWLALPQTPDVRAAMTKDASILLKSLKRTGDGKGFYDYNPGGKNYSHSRAQYAVLGLWAAAQSGVAIPREYWQLVQQAWTGHQDSSGGWNYIFHDAHYPVTAGMTAVGVATLFIADDELQNPTRNPAIDRGLQWLTSNFANVASDEKSARAYPYATLYAIERIGVASGVKYFGNVDWFDKGADFLLKQQRADGGFTTEFPGIKASSTCFALLFLSRGAAPILMNKLDYSAAMDGRECHWNQHPRDVANLGRWVGKQVERDLNWQVVTLDSPLDDLQESQILYLSGNQEIPFKPDHLVKLKSFIEQGGMIVANADGASANFAASFKSLGKKLFPAYDFAPLPDSHPIYTAEQFHRTDWKHKPQVLSLGNGVREFMILLADSDPARAWQSSTAREELFQLPADIFLYANDKQNLRRRDESYVVTRDDKVQSTRSIKLARLLYAGNADPEPAGWRRLAPTLHNTNKIDLQLETIDATHLAGQKLVHLTGTKSINFTPDDREKIKAFLNNGGTLLIDAAGGSTAFAASIESELAQIIPEAKQQLAQPLPPDHPIYANIKTINYRNFARTKLGLLKTGQLRGITINNRLAVIYSKEDLSRAGLVGQSVDGIVGYDPATATALMMNMVLFADREEKSEIRSSKSETNPNEEKRK